MYAWIWSVLPGNRLLKALGVTALVAATLWLLVAYVFPWLEGLIGLTGRLTWP